MWEVVFADGELHEMEDHVLWHIADLIGVSQRDRVELRRKAAKASQAETLDS
ncbi:MAG: TerB family tellurite resistance protein [Rhizobiaceae bacterium]